MGFRTGQIPGSGNCSEFFKLKDFLCVKMMVVMPPYQDVWGPTEKMDVCQFLVASNRN